MGRQSRAKNLARSQRLAEMVCDFCTHQPVVRIYGVPEYLVREDETSTGHIVGQISEGGWAVCADCERLIAARDQPALSRRAMEQILRESSQTGITFTRNEILGYVEPMHIQFFAWLEEQSRSR